MLSYKTTTQHCLKHYYIQLLFSRETNQVKKQNIRVILLLFIYIHSSYSKNYNSINCISSILFSCVVFYVYLVISFQYLQLTGTYFIYIYIYIYLSYKYISQNIKIFHLYCGITISITSIQYFVTNLNNLYACRYFYY